MTTIAANRHLVLAAGNRGAVQNGKYGSLAPCPSVTRSAPALVERAGHGLGIALGQAEGEELADHFRLVRIEREPDRTGVIVDQRGAEAERGVVIASGLPRGR